MKKLFLLLIAIFCTVFLFTANKALASHASGGYITYQYISANTYQITLHFYRDCVGVTEPNSATVTYSSSCGGGGTVSLAKAGAPNGLPVEQSPCIPPVNTTCTGGSAYGIREWIYTGTVVLPIGCADWKFSYSLCCRNAQIGTILNPGSRNLYIESMLNNLTAPTNTSPVFGGIGISQFCNGSPVIWNQSATDIDNDSLAYTLVCPEMAAGTSLPFAGGRTCLDPIAALPPVALDPVTGIMTLTPNLSQVAVIAVKVSEYRAGILIGYVIRDMQVNVVNNCTIIPFDNAWLGYNINWDDPINWCKGVPTLLTSAVVRSVGGPGYVSPIIKNNVFATAKSLKISNNDSVTINASASGSLTMADSLQNNVGSQLIVKGSFYGEETLGNGTFTTAPFTPFVGNRSDARMQILYRASDLLGVRMLPGDVIQELCFHIFRRRSLDAYQNFTIKYYTTNQTSYVINTDATTTSGPFVIYSNSIPGESLAGIPYNAGGIHTITLDAPFVWNGGNFIIEICFDELFLSPPGNNTDVMTQTRTTGANTVLLHEQTASNFGVTGCGNLTNGPQVVSSISEYRPNITFKYFRPYTEYPINIAGTWLNNGTFVAADSKVTFDGTVIQAITGTSTTVFDDVEINKPSGQLIQMVDATVDSSIALTNGLYNLNTNTLTINYSAGAAIASTNGYFLSDNLPPNYGEIRWNIGSTTGAHTIPFGNLAARRIPLTLTPLSGDFGSVTFSTFNTGAPNIPFPLGVTGIPYVFSEMIDRFWNISRTTGGGITADLLLSYDEVTEEAIPSTPNKHVTRWNGSGWDLTAPFVPYLSVSGRREVIRTGTTNISPNWAIGNEPNPLPIQLLTFDGEAQDDHNHIWWITASEINSDRFEVEKSLDLVNFELITTENAQGYSNTEQYYSIKDNFPVKGMQYYRLKSFDLDGSFEYSKAIAIYHGPYSNFEVISVVPNSANNQISIDFIYNSSKDLNIVVSDLVGKTIHKEVYSKKVGDNHHIDLNVNLSSAFYFLTFYNEDLKITKKIVF